MALKIYPGFILKKKIQVGGGVYQAPRTDPRSYGDEMAFIIHCKKNVLKRGDLQ